MSNFRVADHTISYQSNALPNERGHGESFVIPLSSYG
jgi:hypothetical protein